MQAAALWWLGKAITLARRRYQANSGKAACKWMLVHTREGSNAQSHPTLPLHPGRVFFAVVGWNKGDQRDDEEKPRDQSASCASRRTCRGWLSRRGSASPRRMSGGWQLKDVPYSQAEKPRERALRKAWCACMLCLQVMQNCLHRAVCPCGNRLEAVDGPGVYVGWLLHSLGTCISRSSAASMRHATGEQPWKRPGRAQGGWGP